MLPILCCGLDYQGRQAEFYPREALRFLLLPTASRRRIIHLYKPLRRSKPVEAYQMTTNANEAPYWWPSWLVEAG